MPRAKKSPEAPDDQPDQLAAAVHQLADQVGLLTTVLDEFRSDFRWAVRNDRLRCPDPPFAVEPQPTPAIELDDGQVHAIAGAVQNKLCNLAGDVERGRRPSRGPVNRQRRRRLWPRRALTRGTESPIL